MIPDEKMSITSSVMKNTLNTARTAWSWVSGCVMTNRRKSKPSANNQKSPSQNSTLSTTTSVTRKRDWDSI